LTHQYNLFIVRYSEIFLKSGPVRRAWENTLLDAIRRVNPEVVITRERGRIWLSGALDPESLKYIFGIVSFSPCVHVPLGELDEAILTYAAKLEIGRSSSFSVRVRRIGKHAFSSQEKAAELGGAILDVYPRLKVNLTRPDREIRVEIRDQDCYLYHEKIPGTGGIPPGVEGSLVSLMSGGIDSPVATWMMMKRGCRIIPIYIALESFLDEKNLERCRAVVSVLQRYQPGMELLVVHDAYLACAKPELKKRGYEKYTCLFCKRRMYRIAEKIAREQGARGIVTGEALGQVASQTLDNLEVLSEAVHIPIYRPLIAYDKEEAIRVAKQIGTYNVSIMKTGGCRAVPDMPATKGRLEKVHELEARISSTCGLNDP
jgi:thiamine biosynthesis protein ThiI